MRRSVRNAALAVGFLAVAVGIAIARRSPATSYEPSIYAGTPPEAWAAFAVALLVALAVTLTYRGSPQYLGIALGGTTVTAIACLPLVRSYRFVGMGDGLTHLGWTKDILDGTLVPHDLFYPGLHGIASLFVVLGGASPERSLLLAVVALFVPFLLFVPLVARDLSGSAAAVGYAAIASWFVLPVTNVATHMSAHTNSNALFLVPVALFALVAYLRRRSDLERLPFGLSPFSVLLAASGLLLLLVHPQQMFNVVLVVGAVSAVQYFVGRRYDDHPASEHSTVHAHFGLLALVFGIWVATHEIFRNALVGLAYGLVSGDVGASGEVGQRETSLADIGGSLPELFAKLFLVGAVVSLFVGLFILLTWLGRTRLDPDGRAFVNYVAIGLFPLTALFAVYFVGTPTMAFRQVGFIFVLLTILVGVAFAHGFGWLGGLLTTPGARALAAALLGACLVLSIATLYASPFIYQPAQHVSDQQYSGYETAIERGDGERPYAGFGFEVIRYVQGTQGVEGTTAAEYGLSGTQRVDPDAFNRGKYGDAYPAGEYYFVVSAWDETREFDVYDGLTHDRAALEGVDRHPGANKVVSNDDFRMYAVSGE